ncbi:4Fe-4S binding protein [Candidatus Falkowbacteria bacterium]|jgi:pyruvate ferredoxin oxidoreductase delta subunit|nr:4Fe-4S binding protein [Candidatus Falkowbacteria bacterium]MBT4439403.1 4Fe-4S binding protein [Elusimicrobiaceae bacterium]
MLMKYKLAVKPGTTRKNKTGGWRTYVPKFLHEKCIACNMCNLVCPENICYPNKKKKKNKSGKIYYQSDLKYCKGCGICAENCPAKAIIMQLDK